MQIPIVSGVYSDSALDLRASYPVNLEPLTFNSGVSDGYLKPGAGIVTKIAGFPGVSRGGVNWLGICYRVMGSKFCRINENNTFDVIGDVGNDGLFVTMNYSFDRLSITSNGHLFYYDGVSLSQVVDPTLGAALDHIYVDGYFMTTDGEFLVVTELNNPFNVLSTKYGSSELDPDNIVALLTLRNEVHAINRYTIEAFDNVGGEGFPFSRIDGAQIMRGCIGTKACCIFDEIIAMVGSARNESPSVYLAANGSSIKIATREIDLMLANYSEATLSKILVEAKIDKDQKQLFIHLPDQSLVYDAMASKNAQMPIWYIASSGGNTIRKYRARNFVWCYNEWRVGDTAAAAVGALANTVSTHWGNHVYWEFTTPILYNESAAAIFHELELVALTGRTAFGEDPRIYTLYSKDGVTWSIPRGISAGQSGDRKKRLVWLQQGPMNKFRIQKFFGTSQAILSFLALEARIEGLSHG